MQSTRTKANSLLLALLLLAQLLIPAAKAEDDPVQAQQAQQWLGKLADAVNKLEYRGLVTFEQAGMLETLQVVRALRNGEPIERVRYLSGDERELISSGSNDDCRRSDSPLARAALWSKAGQEEMQKLYQFYLRGEERIADRDTVIIEARPRDRHRLGLVVNLDRETGLPLKSMLVGSQGRVLERYQFVQLDLSPQDDRALQAESAAPRRIDNSQACTSIESRWQLRWLPEGFKAVSARHLPDGEMLVFSDGLSVFTVFVQQLGPGMDFNGRAIRGATVAYMDHIKVAGSDYTITVVGEIPDNTAQLVARALAAKG
jgi:sigma-E factor negative regulatory protein RseB